jgi:hypothetical protein
MAIDPWVHHKNYHHEVSCLLFFLAVQIS